MILKKFTLLVLLVSFALGMVACSGEEPAGNGDGNLEGSLEEILAAIYETAEVSANFKEFIGSGLQTTEITADNCEFHLGKADLEYETAIASEPVMQPSAYELCLVRVKGADIEQIKTGSRECRPDEVGLRRSGSKNIIVDHRGDVVILIMSDNEAGAAEAFLALE